MSLDLAAPWDTLPLVVIDTETTGVDTSTDQIVEIAAARFERGELVDVFSSLVNPGIAIPAAASAVHGITDAMVAGAPPIEALAGELLRVCTGAVPCAYNSTFDRALLHARITGKDCAAFDPDFLGWICPLVVVREVDRYVRGAGRHRLEATCARWGVNMDDAHRARADAIAAGKLVYRMLEKGAIKSCSLRSMLETTERKRVEQEARFQEWLAAQPPRAAVNRP